MRLTLTWKPAAEEKLAALWAVASDRASFQADADWIDSTLRQAGDTAGEFFIGASRILRTRTIAVLFTVNMDDRIVTVTDVLRRKPDTP